MTALIAPFGLAPSSTDWPDAAGEAGPLLRAISAADANSYAAGDLVVETGDSIGGVPVVTSALPQAYPGGATVTPIGRRGASLSALCLIVAVSPDTPGHASQAVLPAGAKGSTAFVWVIRAGSREFFVAGDASAPAWGDWQPSGAPVPTLHAQSVEAGGLFARLTYGAPTAGLSGTALAGASFTSDPSADVAVVGFGPGMSLGPRSMYRVRLAAPIATVVAAPARAASDGM